MPFPEIDPVAFAIGPFAVRWYALAYLGGILFGALYGARLLARRTLWHASRPPFPAPAIWDFAFWAVVGIIINNGNRTLHHIPYSFLNKKTKGQGGNPSPFLIRTL